MDALGRTAAEPSGFSVVFPHVRTMSPSGLYSMTGGDATAVVPSWPVSPFACHPRLTVMTWSFELMQLPPGSPETHWWPSGAGRGLGQNGSTWNLGTLSLASDTAALGCASRLMPTAPATAAAAMAQEYSPAFVNMNASPRMDVARGPFRVGAILLPPAKQAPGTPAMGSAGRGTQSLNPAAAVAGSPFRADARSLSTLSTGVAGDFRAPRRTRALLIYMQPGTGDFRFLRGTFAKLPNRSRIRAKGGCGDGRGR